MAEQYEDPWTYWEADKHTDDSVVSYFISMQEKLQQMADIVQDNLSKAQAKQRWWYNENARMRRRPCYHTPPPRLSLWLITIHVHAFGHKVVVYVYIYRFLSSYCKLTMYILYLYIVQPVYCTCGFPGGAVVSTVCCTVCCHSRGWVFESHQG